MKLVQTLSRLLSFAPSQVAEMSTKNVTSSESSVDVSAILNNFKCIVVIFGFLGNLVFLISTFKRPMGSKVTVFLLRCQSTFDLSVCLITIITLYQPPFWTTGISGLDIFICQMWHSQLLFWAFVFVSVQNLLLIAVDRFMAVVMPQIYRVGNPTHRKIGCVLVLLLYTGIIAPPSGLQARYNSTTGECTGEYINDEQVTKDFFSAYAIIWFLTCYFIPTLLFAILYGKVLHVLFKPSVGASEDTGSSTRQAFARSFTIVTIVVTGIFILSLSYDSIYYLLGYLGVTSYSVNSPIQTIGVFLVSFNSCANPYVYFLLLKPFRQAIKDTLMFWKTQPKEAMTGVSATTNE